MLIKIDRSKRMYPTGSRLAVQGEHLAQSIAFELPRYDGELDLSLYRPQVEYQNQEGKGEYIRSLEMQVTDQTITLFWKPSWNATQLAGILYLQVVFAGEEDELVWKSDRGRYLVSPSVNGSLLLTAWYPSILTDVEKMVEIVKAHSSLLQFDGEGSRYLADDGKYKSLQELSGGYTQEFGEGDFVGSGRRYLLRVPLEAHGLGHGAVVKEVQRACEEGMGNILGQYVTLPNGDVVLYADEPFAGRMILEGT